MKRLFLAAIAVMITAFSVNAQVKIESPHPDLGIKVTRCAYANGTVVIDMLITNFGTEERIISSFRQVSAYDDEGNMYNGSTSKIEMGVTNTGLDNGFDVVFPQDVPLKFRLQIDKISVNASKFALLKFGVESHGSMSLKTDKPIQFRNLEWAK
ncbi:MAG: hypothetical protein SNH13_03995 [Rikenellaceae bacterium]